MRKDVKVNATVDPVGAAILAAIADREAEGNRSQALRRVLREAAAVRGLDVHDVPHQAPEALSYAS